MRIQSEIQLRKRSGCNLNANSIWNSEGTERQKQFECDFNLIFNYESGRVAICLQIQSGIQREVLKSIQFRGQPKKYEGRAAKLVFISMKYDREKERNRYRATETEKKGTENEKLIYPNKSAQKDT